MDFMEFLMKLFNSISTNQVFMQFYLKINPVYLKFQITFLSNSHIIHQKYFFIKFQTIFFYSDIKIDHFHNILSLS